MQANIIARKVTTLDKLIVQKKFEKLKNKKIDRKLK